VALAGNETGIQARARELADTYVTNPMSLPGTLAPAVLRVAAASGDTALYDRYVAQLDEVSAQPEEYYRFLGALPFFRDPALVQRTLNFAISPAVRTQDTGNLIAGLLGQSHARDAAWAFVQEKWPILTQKLGTFQGIPDIIGALGSFCSTEAAAQVKQFFTRNRIPSSERTLRRSIERIETCATLVERQSPALDTWISAAR
jgi:aminopeptidase N/puromycin-sensitive aminopeptidase